MAVNAFLAVLQDSPGLLTVGILLENLHQSLGAGHGTGYTGFTILINDIHLDQFHPGRGFAGKQGFGKNLLLHDFRFLGSDYPVNTVLVPIVMHHIGALFRPGNGFGHISPPIGGLTRYRPGLPVNCFPLLSGKMFYYLLDKRIICIIIDLIPPLQKLVEIIWIVAVWKRHTPLPFLPGKFDCHFAPRYASYLWIS